LSSLTSSIMRLRPPFTSPLPYTSLFRSYPLPTHLGGDWWASLADGVARVPEPGPGIDKDRHPPALWHRFATAVRAADSAALAASDRKSTRLNSSHVSTSYAVFCLKIKIT